MSLPGSLLPFGVDIRGNNFRIDKQLIKSTVFVDETLTGLNSANLIGVITPVLGSEVLDETAFATHANWDDTGDMLSTSGAAVYTHSSGVGTLKQVNADQALNLENDTWYKLQYTISGVTPGSVSRLTSAVALVAKVLDMTAGTKTVYFLSAAAAASADFVISVTSESAGIFTLDDITLKKVANTNLALRDLADNTFTADQVLGGYIQLDPEEDITVNLPTVALLEAAAQPLQVNSSFELLLKNSGVIGEVLTVNAGSGMILDPITLTIDGGLTVLLIFRRVSKTAWTVHSIPVAGKPIKTGYVRYTNIEALSAVNVKANAQIADISAQSPVDQPDYPRTVLLTRATYSALTAGTVTIIGVDVNGKARTAVYTLPPNDTNISVDDAGFTIAWATITSWAITDEANADGNDVLSIGYTDIIGLPSSQDGQLIDVHKAIEADDDETIGAVSSLNSTVVAGQATDGTVDFAWLYTYV